MNKIILILIILFLFIVPSMAVDNTIESPVCINPSYDSGYVFLTTGNHATLGNISSRAVTAGYLSPSVDRVHNGVNLLCAISDPTSSGLVGGTQRLFGVSEDGSVWYTDTTDLDYALGFYTLLSPTYLYKIGTLSSVTANRKMAIDSMGNLYVGDGLAIYKFVKTLDYSPQLWHTLVANSDYTPSIGTTIAYNILGLQFDSSDQLHVLTGGSATTNAGAGIYAYLDYSVLDISGTHIGGKLALAIQHPTGTSPPAYGIFYGGGLVLDATNSMYNYTYAYYGVSHGSAVDSPEYILKHNSTIGTTTIATLTGITDISDIAYNNYQIYIASSAQNLIRSYVTTFAGKLPGSVSSGTPAELTYSTSTINILETAYYNNTPIDVNVNVVVDLSGQTLAEDLLNTQDNYRWKMQLNDPNGAQAAFYISGTCTEIEFYCFMNKTLLISPPSNNWTSGTYTAYLKEYNIDTYTESTLATDTTTVLNTSTNNTGITITEPITSGTGTTALSSIDSWTALFGLGVNPISKFLFALVLILAAMFFGYIATRNSTMGGIIAAALPFCFFVFISYIPVWTIVIVVLIIALKGKWVG